MATATVETPIDVAAVETPMDVAAAEIPASATKSSYRKNFTQKNGCRYVNYEPSEEDVTTFMHRLDIIERLLETKHYIGHVIHFPWRLASDERVVERLRAIKFKEYAESGFIIQLWADSNNLPLAMDIMMNSWGIPTSSIRHECVVDHSSKFSTDVQTHVPYGASKQQQQQEEEVVVVKGVEESKDSDPKGADGAEEEKKEKTAEEAPKRKRTGKRKKEEETAAAAAEEKKDEAAPAAAEASAPAAKKEPGSSSFDPMPANIPPVTGRTLCRPTLEHLLVAEVNLPASVYLKSAQSRLGFPTWKNEGAVASSSKNVMSTVLEPQHPEGIRRLFVESLTVQQVPRVLEWFDTTAMRGPFNAVGVNVPGWFYINPASTRRKKDVPVIDLVTLLYVSLSKKLPLQALDNSIKLTSKILSPRTNEANRVQYQAKLLTLITARTMENATLDTYMQSLPRWEELRALLGIESVTELGMNFYEALLIALRELKENGRFLLKKQKRKRGAEAEVDENGNPVPAKKRPPTGFREPTKVSQELAEFLGLQDGELIARTQVVKRIHAYIDEHGLKIAEDPKFIQPDQKLGAILGTNDKLGHFALSTYLEKHYPEGKKAKAAAAAAAAAAETATA